MSSRGGLLASIQRGTNLRQVGFQVNDRSVPVLALPRNGPPPPPPGPGARAAAAPPPPPVAVVQFEYVDRDSIDEELACCVCTLPFTAPVCTPCCGQNFCKTCLTGWISQREQTCPTCRSRLTLAMCNGPTNRALQSLVDKLRVFCVMKDRGCNEIHKRADAEHHRQECQFQDVSCPHAGCMEKLLRRDLAAHAEACQHQTKQHECGATIKLLDIANHCATVCPAQAVPCVACKEPVARAKMGAHLDFECASSELKCIHRQHGCTFVGTRDAIAAHGKVCVFEALRGFIERTQSELTSLRAEVAQLRAAAGIQQGAGAAANPPARAGAGPANPVRRPGGPPPPPPPPFNGGRANMLDDLFAPPPPPPPRSNPMPNMRPSRAASVFDDDDDEWS